MLLMSSFPCCGGAQLVLGERGLMAEAWESSQTVCTPSYLALSLQPSVRNGPLLGHGSTDVHYLNTRLETRAVLGIWPYNQGTSGATVHLEMWNTQEKTISILEKVERLPNAL